MEEIGNSKTENKGFGCLFLEMSLFLREYLMCFATGIFLFMALYFSNGGSPLSETLSTIGFLAAVMFGLAALYEVKMLWLIATLGMSAVLGLFSFMLYVRLLFIASAILIFFVPLFFLVGILGFERKAILGARLSFALSAGIFTALFQYSLAVWQNDLLVALLGACAGVSFLLALTYEEPLFMQRVGEGNLIIWKYRVNRNKGD